MSKPTPATPLQQTTIDEAGVVEYLRLNPDVLERHPEVLTSLTFNHDSGSAISLVERQLKLLRDENQSLKNKLSELVHIARENEELGQRFHRLSLELIAVNNLHDLIAIIRDQLQTFFYTDYATFYFSDQFAEHLQGLEKHILDSKHSQAGTINDWIKERKPVFGPIDPELHKLLFDSQMQSPSCVLIPLYDTKDFGLLALGSKSKDRFSHSMGTLFLSQLGDLVSSKLKHFLG
jgi:uncharacterized protein YigA (DUF484 family)